VTLSLVFALGFALVLAVAFLLTAANLMYDLGRSGYLFSVKSGEYRLREQSGTLA